MSEGEEEERAFGSNWPGRQRRQPIPTAAPHHPAHPSGSQQALPQLTLAHRTAMCLLRLMSTELVGGGACPSAAMLPAAAAAATLLPLLPAAIAGAVVPVSRRCYKVCRARTRLRWRRSGGAAERVCSCCRLSWAHPTSGALLWRASNEWGRRGVAWGRAEGVEGEGGRGLGAAVSGWPGLRTECGWRRWCAAALDRRAFREAQGRLGSLLCCAWNTGAPFRGRRGPPRPSLGTRSRLACLDRGLRHGGGASCRGGACRPLGRSRRPVGARRRALGAPWSGGAHCRQHERRGSARMAPSAASGAQTGGPPAGTAWQAASRRQQRRRG